MSRPNAPCIYKRKSRTMEPEARYRSGYALFGLARMWPNRGKS